MVKILLHVCCANCAIYPVKRLRENNFDVSGFWYNPNIHPCIEHLLRFNSTVSFANSQGLKLIHKDTYEPENHLRMSIQSKEERCYGCYRLRLYATAETAVENHLEAFTTTLLFSKYQNFDSIVGIGYEASERYGIKFLAEDFRKGWDEGRRLSLEMGFYRQKYCGCVFSRKEIKKNNKDGVGGKCLILVV
ncbi:MAG: epoxyqueuosine reductase QueH [Nitrospirota bacterium]